MYMHGKDDQTNQIQILSSGSATTYVLEIHGVVLLTVKLILSTIQIMNMSTEKLRTVYTFQTALKRKSIGICAPFNSSF